MNTFRIHNVSKDTYAVAELALDANDQLFATIKPEDGSSPHVMAGETFWRMLNSGKVVKCDPVTIAPVVAPTPTPALSTWEKPVVDDAAKARIEAMHESVGLTNGVTHGQAYTSGTKLAAVGVQNGKAARVQFEKRPLATEALADFALMIQGEKRENSKPYRARDLKVCEVTADGIRVQNGRDYLVSPELCKDVLSRIGARRGSASYMQALWGDGKYSECAELFGRELRDSQADNRLVFRHRNGVPFAVVSPSYQAVDGDLVAKALLHELRMQPEADQARASISYDYESTSASLDIAWHTPIPEIEQAVGEPFRARMGVSFRDNGQGGIRPGGGFELVVCLNYTTTEVDAFSASIRHVGRASIRFRTSVKDAAIAILPILRAYANAKCDHLGSSAKTTDGSAMPVRLEDAIPGFWRSLLAPRGELVGLVPANKVKDLTAATLSESTYRNSDGWRRSDMVNGLTKWAQAGTSDPYTRDSIERAAGNILRSTKPMVWMPEARS